MRKKRIPCMLLLLFHGAMALFLPGAVGAAVSTTVLSANTAMHLQTMPFEEALGLLSRKLNARVIVFGMTNNQKTATLMIDRSPLEQLKSILKSHDYAIIYNDPSPSYDSFDHLPLVGGGRSDPAGDGQPHPAGDVVESNADKEHQRLARRIERLEQEIASGSADKFFERWSKVRDPKYIYSHRKELDRLREKLAAPDGQASAL